MARSISFYLIRATEASDYGEVENLVDYLSEAKEWALKLRKIVRGW
jgi:hypothetical protein